MLTIVVGPPAAGKTTWVRENAAPDAVVIDLDVIASALTPSGEARHEHSRHLLAIAQEARQAAIARALRLAGSVDVYVIHTEPGVGALRLYRKHGAKVHVVDPGADVVLPRVQAERSPRAMDVARGWYARHARP